MERLTYFKDGYWRVNFSGVQYQADFVDRLAAYEDTGLTPKEVTALGELFDYALKESKTLAEQLTLLHHIRELAEADKDGRVVVLPCKVGDTVYMIERIFDIDNGVCDEICARKVIGYGGNKTE